MGAMNIERCPLCDTPLRFEQPDGSVMEFTKHDDEFCRAATVSNIAMLKHALEMAGIEAAQLRRACSNARRWRDALERIIKINKHPNATEGHEAREEATYLAECALGRICECGRSDSRRLNMAIALDSLGDNRSLTPGRPSNNEHNDGCPLFKAVDAPSNSTIVAHAMMNVLGAHGLVICRAADTQLAVYAVDIANAVGNLAVRRMDG